jgi:SPP1 family predicted phage head-tail adaptor
MQGGELDRRIIIQDKTETRDSYGQPIPSWSQVGKVRWANYRPIRGTERFVSEQFLAREQVEFQVRWTTDLADLSPMDRVVYPVPAVGETPTDSETYEIMAVHEFGRRVFLRILTARRSETAT